MNQFPQNSSPSSPQMPPSFNSADYNQMVQRTNLVRRARSGASTFYWIAALSALNSLIAVFGGNVFFVVGLGFNMIVAGVAIGLGKAAPSIALIANVIGIVLNIVIAGIFALFGYFAGKGYRWAFITGMVLYALDAVLSLLFQDWIGVLFHLYFLWLLFSGLQAFDQLLKLPPLTSTNVQQQSGNF